MGRVFVQETTTPQHLAEIHLQSVQTHPPDGGASDVLTILLKSPAIITRIGPEFNERFGLAIGSPDVTAPHRVQSIPGHLIAEGNYPIQAPNANGSLRVFDLSVHCGRQNLAYLVAGSSSTPIETGTYAPYDAKNRPHRPDPDPGGMSHAEQQRKF